MKCEKYLNLIDDLVEGELDERTAGQVNLHIFACAECASEYKTLKREKEIYAHYLFDVEPSVDLASRFQAKLSAETNKNSPVAEPSVGAFCWKTKLFSVWRLSPALACAAVLIGLAMSFGLLKFILNEKTAETERAVTTDLSETRAEIAETSKVDERQSEDSPVVDENNKGFSSAGRIANNGENKAAKIKISAPGTKFTAVKSKEIKDKIITANKKENLTKAFQPNEQERQLTLQARNLENETFKQIEKIELLLRSFRNAKSNENSEMFDVAYEKEQARKLLKKNVQLRQNAGNYAAFHTGELLDKAEPFLLDIANLENDTSAEKVLEIKDRVKNQSIIASLQIYK